MKKLSLVEIPTNIWNSDDLEEKKDDDAGFVSANEDEERVVQNAVPSGYYHSLPLKYSRQRKAQFMEEKKKSVRANVVKEILSTEQNYVKRLNDIVQGFVLPCRARQDLFSERTVTSIFSNTEDILKVHLKILESLKACVDEENPSEARIGHIFSDWAEDFDLYSEYCYQNPMSMATVRQLTLNREYEEFFEACRRLQLMEKLPLHGFLLRPIQRICQYHLILNELLKHTPVGSNFKFFR
jgi:Rho guanine nucleotide exchange factor 4